MSRASYLLLALVLAFIAWWFSRDDAMPPTRPGVPNHAHGSDTDANANVTPSPAPRSASAPEPAPNSATARWLADLQRPRGKPYPLPYPLDASLDRAAARALYRKSQDVSDCYVARGALDTSVWEQWTGTRWLDAAERERVLKALQAAVARQIDSCRRHGMSEVDGVFSPTVPAGFVRWARTSAAASGDPAARAVHFQAVPRRVDVDTEIRPVVRELLLADPVDIPVLALLHGRYGAEMGAVLQMDPARAWRNGARLDPEALWLLVACDMGMDCVGTGAPADRLCVDQGLCGYPDVESAVRDGLLGSSELELTLQARQQIVALLRRGDVDAIVNRPPPEPPKPRRR